MEIPKILGVFIGLAIIIVALEPVHAAVFNCPAGDVGCLIDAINTANSNGEDDTINLESSTYTLTDVNNINNGPNGLPVITSTIHINGAESASTAIERPSPSHNDFRIFNVTSTGKLVLDNITVSNGRLNESGNSNGAGIYNEGTSDIINCIFEHNWTIGAGGGIFNSGILAISNSNISGNYCNQNGGGLTNRQGGTAIITNSVIDNNTAWGRGGGIENIKSELSVEACTISNNIALDGDGGGIYNIQATLSMINSTISNNYSRSSVGGGIFLLQGKMTLTNCTVSGNRAPGGGGIYSGGNPVSNNPGIVELTNTIVAGNRNTANDNSGSDCSKGLAGTIISLGHNLVGNGTGCPSNGTADLTVDPAEVFTTVIGPLADNGGATFTHDLLPGSMAIDAGSNDCPSTDQLGNHRVDGDANGIITCDIGSIEKYLKAAKRIQNPDNGHWYQVFDNTMTWHEAKDYCKSIGGYLATITSQQENDFVFENLVYPIGHYCWLGGTDETNEGTWQWITGEAWEYSNWNPGEPNDGCDGEDYLHIYYEIDTWNDDDNDGFCARGLKYPICEWGHETINDFVTFDPDPSTNTFTPDTTGCPSGFAGTYSFDAKLTNISLHEITLSDILLGVVEFTGESLLKNANGGPGGAGAWLTVPEIDEYSDGELSSEESVDVTFEVCLKNKDPFSFFVDVWGVVKDAEIFTPANMTGLRSFDDGRNVFLLGFDAVKTGTEDRTVAHFDIGGLSGVLPSSLLSIPIRRFFDPGLPGGIFEVYSFSGDGVVSTDEWNVGSLIHTFTDIPAGVQLLSMDITELLQTAVDNGNSYLSFSFRGVLYTDRYDFQDESGNFLEPAIIIPMINQ